MEHSSPPDRPRTQFRYNEYGPANYRKAKEPDRAVIHLFLEALYIAGREDHFHASKTEANRRGATETFPSMGLDYDIPASSPTLRHWWAAAQSYSETGLVDQEAHGHMLSLSTPGHIAAAYARESTPSLRSLIGFIADQFSRDENHPNLTLTQELTIREFAERYPSLFMAGKTAKPSRTLMNELSPKNIVELIETNIFVAPSPYGRARPEEELTHRWQHTIQALSSMGYDHRTLKRPRTNADRDRLPAEGLEPAHLPVGPFTEAEEAARKSVSPSPSRP